jgi:hypothetical protein
MGVCFTKDITVQWFGTLIKSHACQYCLIIRIECIQYCMYYFISLLNEGTCFSSCMTHIANATVSTYSTLFLYCGAPEALHCRNGPQQEYFSPISIRAFSTPIVHKLRFVRWTAERCWRCHATNKCPRRHLAIARPLTPRSQCRQPSPNMSQCPSVMRRRANASKTRKWRPHDASRRRETHRSALYLPLS